MVTGRVALVIATGRARPAISYVPFRTGRGDLNSSDTDRGNVIFARLKSYTASETEKLCSFEVDLDNLLREETLMRSSILSKLISPLARS